MFHCFIAFFVFLHFPLSGPVLTYISLLIIPCMIVYVTNNKEPWTLNQTDLEHEENITHVNEDKVYIFGWTIPFKFLLLFTDYYVFRFNY